MTCDIVTVFKLANAQDAIEALAKHIPPPVGAAQHMKTCASPAYLAKYGVPATLDDLRHHQAINWLNNSPAKHIPPPVGAAQHNFNLRMLLIKGGEIRHDH
jgi:hypothetical protein